MTAPAWPWLASDDASSRAPVGAPQTSRVCRAQVRAPRHSLSRTACSVGFRLGLGQDSLRPESGVGRKRPRFDSRRAQATSSAFHVRHALAGHSRKRIERCCRCSRRLRRWLGQCCRGLLRQPWRLRSGACGCACGAFSVRARNIGQAHIIINCEIAAQCAHLWARHPIKQWTVAGECRPLCSCVDAPPDEHSLRQHAHLVLAAPVRFRSLATVGSGRPSATEAGWVRRERRAPGLMRGCHAARDAVRAGLTPASDSRSSGCPQHHGRVADSHRHFRALRSPSAARNRRQTLPAPA